MIAHSDLSVQPITALGFVSPDAISVARYAAHDLAILAARAEEAGYPLQAAYFRSAARFLRAGATIWVDLDTATEGDA